jgi:hypothetical protein
MSWPCSWLSTRTANHVDKCGLLRGQAPTMLVQGIPALTGTQATRWRSPRPCLKSLGCVHDAHYAGVTRNALPGNRTATDEQLVAVCWQDRHRDPERHRPAVASAVACARDGDYRDKFISGEFEEPRLFIRRQADPNELPVSHLDQSETLLQVRSGATGKAFCPFQLRRASCDEFVRIVRGLD